MATGQGNSKLPSLQDQHKLRLTAILREAEAAAGNLQMIISEIKQVLEQGGTISIQAQMAFVFGAFLRMQKDWGVTEHVQQLGARQKKPIDLKK
ncbi:hypothetical protein FJY94_00220 [Candidatus Kaiserbacteria bacterium]|nr:hypothetical protein [Candidatus Kaiserbacteria bacterium]